MKLESDYFNSMDKEKTYNLDSMGGYGISTPPMKNQLQSLQTAIKQGAGAIELGFMGRGKGSHGKGATTPGLYGKEERQAMKNLAKINEVNLTTHASPAVGNFSGLQRGEFNEQSRKEAIDEVNRTTEFAAETAEGGPVVMHVGEYPRPVSEAGVEEKEKRSPFQGFSREPEQRGHPLVDKKTGKIIDSIKEDRNNFVPRKQWKDLDKKDPSKWENQDLNRKNFEYDREESLITTGKEEPVYAKDPNTNTLAYEKRDWDSYCRQAEWNKKMHGKNPKKYPRETYPINPAVLFYRDSMESQRAQIEGQAAQYERHYLDGEGQLKRVNNAINFWKEIEKSIPNEGSRRKKWQELVESYPDLRTRGSDYSGLVKGTEPKDPLSYLKKVKNNVLRDMAYGKGISGGDRARLKDLEDKQNRAVPIEDFALGRTADSIARAGVYAGEQQTQKKLKKDLFVAPENIFPEQYGSHPEELKNVVEKSRKRMVQLLTNPNLVDLKGDEIKDSRHRPIKNAMFKPGISKHKAEEMASNHIKATFDVAHANTWKRFFTGKDKDFKKWMNTQVKKLVKSGVIGHVHISDNFGWHDDHLPPGHGNTPIKDFIKELKKSGYEGKVTVEPGEKGIEGLTEHWRMLNSPVYSIDGASRGWTDVQHGYFGKTYTPNFLYGGLSPDKDLPQNQRTWSVWSGMGLE